MFLFLLILLFHLVKVVSLKIEKRGRGGADEFVDFVSNAGPYAMNATSEPYVVNIGFCMCYVDRLSIFKL